MIDKEKAYPWYPGIPDLPRLLSSWRGPGESVRNYPREGCGGTPLQARRAPERSFPGVIGETPPHGGRGKNSGAGRGGGDYLRFHRGLSGGVRGYVRPRSGVHTPFSETQNVVLMVEPRGGDWIGTDYEAALREAGLKLALHLAQECKETPAEKVEIFDLPSVKEVQKTHPELPGIVYVFMCITQGTAPRHLSLRLRRKTNPPCPGAPQRNYGWGLSFRETASPPVIKIPLGIT